MGKAKQVRDKVKVMEDRLAAEVEAAEERGRRLALGQMVSFLEEKFMDPALDMTTVQGMAITAVAGELVARFRPEGLFGSQTVDGTG